MTKFAIALVAAFAFAVPAAQSAPMHQGGAATVRGVLAAELKAQNAGNWRTLYQMFDPVARNGNCSFKTFRGVWVKDAATRPQGRLRYSKITVWTDETGDYAFASYDIYAGSRLLGRVAVGQDSFVRRDGRWYDRFEDGQFAQYCAY